MKYISSLVLASILTAFAVSTATAAAGEVVLDKTGTVWYINSLGQRRGFQNPEIFQANGFKFSQVRKATAAELDLLPIGPVMTRPNGVTLKAANNPTVYLILANAKIPFSSAQEFLAAGYDFKNVVITKASVLAALDTVNTNSLPAVAGITTTNATPSSPVINGPNILAVNVSTNFSGYSQDADGSPLNYTTNWGDGSALETVKLGSGYPFIFKHTWTKTGAYTITIMATDDTGDSRATSMGVTVQ